MFMKRGTNKAGIACGRLAGSPRLRRALAYAPENHQDRRLDPMIKPGIKLGREPSCAGAVPRYD